MCGRGSDSENLDRVSILFFQKKDFDGDTIEHSIKYNYAQQTLYIIMQFQLTCDGLCSQDH